MFWLARTEQLCELITDPAYSLEDEIVAIPHGAGYRWIIGVLFDEGKIPARIMDEIFVVLERPLG